MPTADNTLVLVIDIQERLLPALSQAEAFSAAAVRFIEGCRLLDVPLLLTEQYPKGLGATIEPVSRACADAPRFEKTRFSAYTPEVAAAIAQKQPENVVLLWICWRKACGFTRWKTRLLRAPKPTKPTACARCRRPAPLSATAKACCSSFWPMPNIPSSKPSPN